MAACVSYASTMKGTVVSYEREGRDKGEIALSGICVWTNALHIRRMCVICQHYKGNVICHCYEREGRARGETRDKSL